MSVYPFDFSSLIAPLTKEEFLIEYWEKKPLVLTGRGKDGYQGFPRLENFEELLTNHPSKEDFSWIRIANSKQERSIQDCLQIKKGSQGQNFLIDIRRRSFFER